MNVNSCLWDMGWTGEPFMVYPTLAQWQLGFAPAPYLHDPTKD